MSDDALLSTPGRDRDERGSGWQEGRMDEGWARGPEGRLSQGAWEAPWLATGGRPSGANSFSPPLQQQAPGHYGPGYGDPTRHFGTDPAQATGSGGPWGDDPWRAGAQQGHGAQPGHDEHHHHYQRFRQEHERRLDEDYQAWRRDNPQSHFDEWRGRHPGAPAGGGRPQATGTSSASGAGREDGSSWLYDRGDERGHEQGDERGAEHGHESARAARGDDRSEGREHGRSEGLLQSLGRAITEVVTGPREPDHDQRTGYNERDQAFGGGPRPDAGAGAPTDEQGRRKGTDRFFERS